MQTIKIRKGEPFVETKDSIDKRVINQLDIPLIRISAPDLIIRDLNKRAKELIGLIAAQGELIGSSIKSSLNGIFNQEDYQSIEEAITQKKNVYLNYKKFIVNSKEIYGKIIVEPIVGNNGEINQLVIFMTDVTEEILAKTVQEEFFANVSHELRTPINVIFSAIQMLECNGKNEDNQLCQNKKYVKMMKQNSYRLLKLVNNLMDLSKIEAGYFNISLNNYNIISIIEDIVMSVAEYAKAKGITITFDTEVEEKIIACDPDIVERIILNLVSNALKFTVKGDRIDVFILDLGNSIDIHIKDTGIGIPLCKQQVIFDRFKQVEKNYTKAQGSGIGLSLVKRLVEMLNGSIKVESIENEGSEFKVNLPAKLAADSSTNCTINVTSVQRNVERINIEFSDIYA